MIRSEEEKANIYTLKCLGITSIITVFLFILNLLDIFIVSKDIFIFAVISNLIVTLAVLILAKLIGLDKPITKYVVLAGSVVVYTMLNASLTYHAILTMIFSIIYSAQYQRRKVMWITFGMTAIGTIVAVLLGYQHGLCDANMVLFTYTSVQDFMSKYSSIKLPEMTPYTQLILFFAFPRIMVLLGVVPIITHIVEILKERMEHVLKAQEENAKLAEKMAETQKDIIISLSSIIASRDETTGDHVKNSSRYVEYLVNKLIEKGIFKEELTEEYKDLTIRAAVLHDVGKIKVSDLILCKNGRLNDDEYVEMKKHTIFGESIMKEIIGNLDENEEYLNVATQMAVSHHERFDGKGYPNGLKGDEIPLCARIMAVADVLDALLSKRQYKKAFTPEETYNIMSGEMDKQFDGRILGVLLENWQEFIDLQ